MSDDSELKRMKNILKFTIGMAELLLAENEQELEAAGQKIDQALQELDMDEELQ